MIQSKSFLLTLSLEVAEPNIELGALCFLPVLDTESSWPLATSISTLLDHSYAMVFSLGSSLLSFFPELFLWVILSISFNTICILRIPKFVFQTSPLPLPRLLIRMFTGLSLSQTGVRRSASQLPLPPLPFARNGITRDSSWFQTKPWSCPQVSLFP